MADTPSVTPDPPRTGGGSGEGQNNKPRRVPASKDSIEAMPRIKVEKGGADDDGCSICLEEFKVDEEGSEMPCKHVFHSVCVETWLRINRSCPVCRFLMPAEEGESNVAEVGSELVQLVLTVSNLADSISMMIRGPNGVVPPAQVDDLDEPLAQQMNSEF